MRTIVCAMALAILVVGCPKKEETPAPTPEKKDAPAAPETPEKPAE